MNSAWTWTPFSSFSNVWDAVASAFCVGLCTLSLCTVQCLGLSDHYVRCWHTHCGQICAWIPFALARPTQRWKDDCHVDLLVHFRAPALTRRRPLHLAGVVTCSPAAAWWWAYRAQGSSAPTWAAGSLGGGCNSSSAPAGTPSGPKWSGACSSPLPLHTWSADGGELARERTEVARDKKARIDFASWPYLWTITSNLRAAQR